MLYTFDCGCSFPIIGEATQKFEIPKLKIDFYQLRYDCEAAWDIIRTGNTVGVFQLETKLGQDWSKRVSPDNLEHLGAIGAILRPGCISYDTKICTRVLDRKGRRYTYKYNSIENLYKNKNKIKNIVSLNEETGKLENNIVEDIIHSGNKDVYKVLLKKTKRNKIASNRYNLKCTLDHPILTNKGYKKLEDLIIGDRIAIIKHSKKYESNGAKYFREICYKHYEYNCVFCDWKEASLDVNHIEGNRKTNNHPDNLNFMCPNHHKMYGEQILSKEQILKAREKYKLKQMEDIEWAEYLGKEFVEKCDVYDITMKAPNHNFIAGRIVVHNCLRAITEDKSMTAHYADRKNNREETKSYHPIVDNCLKETYNLLVYQEQAMSLAKEVAMFSLEEADNLRKAMGKKLASEMAKVKTMFKEKALLASILTEAQIDEVFGWIQESQRYSFNKSILADTIIETNDGLKTIKNLKIGEHINSPDGFIEVLDKYDHGEQEVYQITMESGKSITCTMQHKFLCEDNIIRTLSEILENNHKIMTDDNFHGV